MKTKMYAIGMSLLLALSCSCTVLADIIKSVTVQPIIVSNDNGSMTAGFFGTPSQESTIKGLINDIWAQAEINVDWLAPNAWNNTFANRGAGTLTMARPTSDLGTIVSAGDLAGVGNADANVIDLYFVQIAAGFMELDASFANGLAFLGSNGITAHVGENLPGFTGGQNVAARVIAHEIGHNLGLDHIIEAQNLMQAAGSPVPGSLLNMAQITTARNSSFARAVPEPSSWLLLATGGAFAAFRRRRVAFSIIS